MTVVRGDMSTRSEQIAANARALVAEGRAAKARMDAEDDAVLELQASLMRRWTAATKEYRSGECTEAEYRDYCLLLRGMARKVSAELCKHHGKSLAARAHAYAAPIRLGATGSGLRSDPSLSRESDVSLPRLPHPSEWNYIPGFIKAGDQIRINYRKVNGREKTFTISKEAHPLRLRRRHEATE